jgi:hypothetical protein
MVESKLVCAYQIGDVESNLNIFEHTPNTSEPLIEIIIKEMLISDITKWIPKKSSAIFNGGQNMKPCFLMLIFGATKSEGLLGHKLRLKDFFLVGILRNLKRCHL